MSEYLLDTNIISELRKGAKCDPCVRKWHATLEPNSTWLSVLVLAEISRGVEMLRSKDPAQSMHLEKWLDGLVKGFSERLLVVDEPIAQRWGILNAKNRISFIDGFLAATAMEHDLVLVTRNVADIENTGVRYLNPFKLE